jgi:cytochrome c556
MIWRKLFGKGQDKASAKMLDDAVEKARNHILAQQLRAVSFLSGINGAGEFQDDPEKMLAVELPFMWGWHHAYAKAAGEWPTTPDMRASIQMTDYLMKHHSFDFQRARAEASALDSMWNEADPLFEAISQRGEESYAKPDEPILGQVISKVIE